MPRSTELLRDIHETNLMYLLLLQRIARSNAAAIAGMQLSVEACAWLTRQNHEDLARLARCSVLLAQLNMAPALLLSMLSQGMGATLRADAPATAVIQE